MLFGVHHTGNELDVIHRGGSIRVVEERCDAFVGAACITRAAALGLGARDIQSNGSILNGQADAEVSYESHGQFDCSNQCETNNQSAIRN